MNTIPQLFNVVYMLTNPLGERYIGSAVDLRARMRVHRREETSLLESIAEHGWENHTLTILAHGVSDAELRAREKEFIRKLKPEINKMKWCGGRLHHAESSKELIADAHRGNKYHLGKTHSTETRNRLRESQKERHRTMHKHRALNELRAIGWPVGGLV